MKLKSRDVGFIAVGVAFALLVLFVAWHESGGPKAERYAQGNVPENPDLATIFDSLDTGDHYFHPNHCVPGQNVVMSPHRYPHTSGENVSTLIHYGMDSMAQPAPQDNDWRVRPPGEVEW